MPHAVLNQSIPSRVLELGGVDPGLRAQSVVRGVK